MATYKALTDQVGVVTEISSPDVLSVGSGVTTSAGNLTISSAGGTTTLSDSSVVISGTLSTGSLLVVALSVAGFNTASMTTTGEFGYLNGAGIPIPTDNLTLATSLTIGAYKGVAGQMATTGIITDARFTTAGGSPANGAQVYLAASTDDAGTGAGKLTATAPVTVGTVSAVVGICIDNTNYAGLKTCSVLLQVKAPILL